jgi:pectate lyase
MEVRMQKAAITILIATIGLTANAQQLAFPGAEGAGCHSIGGRGGTIYEVTNLNDSGAGSLRAAVEAGGPRIVVFRISGTIELQSTLRISNPFITIAGQTAPGAGICLKNYGLRISADHVIVRYIRCRPGDNRGEGVDGLSVSSGRDIIIDHCSASWAVDETLSVSTSGRLGNVTVQWCLITESLNCSVHSKGCHGYGSLVRGGWGNVYSFHHNLYAHHKGRSPRPGNYNDHSTDPDGLVFDFRNNVVYNWGGSYAGYNADTDSLTKMNFANNYYKAGPDSTDNYAFKEKCTAARAYFSGNYMNAACPGDPWSLVNFDGFTEAQKNAYKQSSPIAVPTVQTDDAMTAYERVLADAGATFPQRDAVDVRVINHVTNGTGAIIDDEDQVGGWPQLESATPPADTDHDGMPDNWELAKGFNPNDPADGPGDRNGDGYTNVEEYLNGL